MSELDLCAASLVHNVLAGNFGPSPAATAVTHKANFEFTGPAYAGDLITMEAELVELKGKHMVIEVRAHTQRRNSPISILVCHASFVFVTRDANNQYIRHNLSLPTQVGAPSL